MGSLLSEIKTASPSEAAKIVETLEENKEKKAEDTVTQAPSFSSGAI